MSRRLTSADGEPEQVGPLTPELLRAATEWYVLQQSGEMDEAERQAFALWQQHPENARAFAELDRVWRQFDAAVPVPARQTLQAVIEEPSAGDHRSSPGKKSPRKKSALGKVATGLCILGCTLVSALVWESSQRPDSAGALRNYWSHAYLGADYRTGIGERQVIVLSDQSRLILNTFSAVNIRYSGSRRQIELVQGEIKLHVARDPARPMVVATQHGSATALGTRYSVYDQGAATRVQVMESRVQVCAEALSSCEVLTRGQATLMTETSVDTPQSMDRSFEYDWQTHQLVVSEQPLLRVLNELSRYHRGVIRMDREVLRDLKVSGVFPLGDPVQALALLEHSLPIEIHRYSPLLTVIQPR